MNEDTRSHGRFVHSQIRLRQRYDLEMNESEYYDIVNDIMFGDGCFLMHVKNDKSLYIVPFKEEILFAVYDEECYEICSFLSLGMSVVRRAYEKLRLM